MAGRGELSDEEMRRRFDKLVPENQKPLRRFLVPADRPETDAVLAGSGFYEGAAVHAQSPAFRCSSLGFSPLTGWIALMRSAAQMVRSFS